MAFDGVDDLLRGRYVFGVYRYIVFIVFSVVRYRGYFWGYGYVVIISVES